MSDSGADGVLEAEPLTASAFAPFGDVIEARDGAARFLINDGTTERFDDLATVDADAAGGRPCIGIVRSLVATALPLAIRALERHPNGSQAFVPLQPAPFLVVVAAHDGGAIIRGPLRAFRSNGRQGVNYRRGVWHHPLIALAAGLDFLVIDRRGPLVDLELAGLASPVRLSG